MGGVMVQEKNMKVQWRALKRIQCFLQIIDDKPKKVKGKVVPNKVIINNCIKKKNAKEIKKITKHLNIDYGKIPKKPKCPKDNGGGEELKSTIRRIKMFHVTNTENRPLCRA